MAIDQQARQDQFEPIAVEPRYKPSRAHVDPDTSKGWIRRMAPVVLAHKWMMAVGLGSSIVMMGGGVAAPRIMMEAIDAGVVAQTAPLMPFVWIILAIAVARAIAGYIFRFYLQRIGYEIEFDLRNLIYEHFQRLSFSFFDRQQTGQLISRANSDIRAVQMFLGFAPMMATTIITFFAAFALMLAIHVPLSLIAILAMPGVYFVGTTMRSRMFPISWVVQARTADAATIVEENVTGANVVRSFAAERQQIGLLTKAAQRLLFASNKQVLVRAQFSPLMQNLPRLGVVAVLIYGGWLVIDGQITIGAILAFNTYLVMLQMPFMMIGFLMMMAQRAAASAGRIFEILDESPQIADKPGATDLVEPLGDVEFRDVTFAYGESEPVLRDFSLHLWPGETVALVGRTGCGKSTVARLIPRFYDPTEGSVLVDGVETRDYNVRSLRAHIGLVLDDPFLFSDSIRDNIRYGRPDANDDDVIRAAKAAGAHDFVSQMPEGYDTVVGERGHTLSGGQRQRIAIARTLLVNPRILILDDATSSIDVKLEQEIHDALTNLLEGRTTLIIAHRLSTISLASRVVLLDQGRVVADGTHQELMRTVPLYAEVLAHAEEEWQEAHAPQPDPMDNLPPRMRTMMRMMKQREESGGRGPMGDMGGMGPQMPGGIS